VLLVFQVAVQKQVNVTTATVVSMLAILVQLRVTTVHLDNIKKKILNRHVNHARKDIRKLQQPVAQFASRGSIKTKSLFVKNAPLAISKRLQDR
jgi:energy-converting hydrogenase Eha subunit H